MIVDTMTFEDITKYLLKTSLSSETTKGMFHKYVEPRLKKYRREIIKWGNNPSHSLYKVFTPIIHKGEYDEVTYMIPLCADKKELRSIYFTVFHYLNKKYVVMKATDETMWYFTWHSLERYAERFLDDKEAEIDIDFIAEMLVYNGNYHFTEYFYKGRHTNMIVTLDGAFLSDVYDNCIVSNTFISEKEYFENQKTLDVKAFDQMKKFIKDECGYWMVRG